jgi:hypothetical protein
MLKSKIELRWLRQACAVVSFFCVLLGGADAVPLGRVVLNGSNVPIDFCNGTTGRPSPGDWGNELRPSNVVTKLCGALFSEGVLVKGDSKNIEAVINSTAHVLNILGREFHLHTCAASDARIRMDRSRRFGSKWVRYEEITLGGEQRVMKDLYLCEVSDLVARRLTVVENSELDLRHFAFGKPLDGRWPYGNVGAQLMPSSDVSAFNERAGGEPQEARENDEKQREYGKRKVADFRLAQKLVPPIALLPICILCVVAAVYFIRVGYAQVESGRWLGAFSLWGGILLAGVGSFGVLVGPIWLRMGFEFYERLLQ